MPTVDPKKFAQFRENVLCLTQPELAEKLEVSKTTISDIENAGAQRHIRPPNFRRLAEIAAMPTEKLLGLIGVAPDDLSPLTPDELAAMKMKHERMLHQIRQEEQRRKKKLAT